MRGVYAIDRWNGGTLRRYRLKSGVVVAVTTAAPGKQRRVMIFPAWAPACGVPAEARNAVENIRHARRHYP